jgi:hypothetical protein
MRSHALVNVQMGRRARGVGQLDDHARSIRWRGAIFPKDSANLPGHLEHNL